MMKSKKGAIFHWIGLVVIFAIVIATTTSVTQSFGVKPKGEWQLQFLHFSFIEGEKRLADTDQLALQVGRETVLSLAEKGGFAAAPSCVVLTGTTYWNKGQDFCFLNVDGSVNTEFNSLYKKYDKNASYTISRLGKELMGKAGQEIVLG